MLFNKERLAAAAELEAAVRHYNALPAVVLAKAAELHDLRLGRSREIVRSASRWARSIVRAPPALLQTIAGVEGALERLAGARPLLTFESATAHLEAEPHSLDRKLSVQLRVRPLEEAEAKGVATTFGPSPEHPIVVALSRVAEVNRGLDRVYDERSIFGTLVALTAFARRHGHKDPRISLASFAVGVGVGLWLYLTRKGKAAFARAEARRVREMSATLERAQAEIERIAHQTRLRLDSVETKVSVLWRSAPSDFQTFSPTDERILQVLVEHLRLLQALLDERVGGAGEVAPSDESDLAA